MKRKMIALFCAGLMLVSSLACIPVYAETEEASEEVAEVPEGCVVIPAADASFTEGEGIGPTNEKEATSLDEETGMIRAAAVGTVITYTVPESAEGTYDIYLTISKILAAFTSMPFTYSINGGDVFTVPVEAEVSADSPFSYTDDGEADTGSLTDTGRFLIKTGVSLKAGDTIDVNCEYGCRSASLKGVAFPYIGELMLAPEGTEVETGYDYTAKTLEEADASDPLSGLDIMWLGSSVTYGAQAAGHYSMVDAIEDNHPGTVCEKYAISATTLVNNGSSSYVERLKLISKDSTPDLFIVQLSTNDASTGKPMGEISESFDMADFDDTTISGAIEFIIAYVQETFGCPVVFYTGCYNEKENYDVMVDTLLEIQEKWGIGVVDLFNDEEMTAIYGTDEYNEYMYDEVHPFKKGYVEWWTPKFEEYLTEYLTAQE